MPRDDYVHQHISDSDERDRLKKIEVLLDPRTKGFLEKLGLKKGMSFLEAGAGGGSLLTWLSEVVGPEGKVLAVDMNTRFLKELHLPNLQVLEDDLTKMDLGTERFDVIHERYVLNHIPDYRSILEKMRSALKPGGWILLEDGDSSTGRIETGDPARLRAFKAVPEARKILFASKGLDYAFGRLLPGLLRQEGFTRVGEETFVHLNFGGQGMAEITRLSVLGLRDQYLKTGSVTQEDLNTFDELASDPNQEAVYYSTVSAWGQKPI